MISLSCISTSSLILSLSLRLIDNYGLLMPPDFYGTVNLMFILSFLNIFIFITIKGNLFYFNKQF